MKTVSLTSSSVKSSTTVMEEDRSETRDSCYFPGCRKDANCKCDICLASFNATLDLMPSSIHRSSLTKFSSSKPARRSPVSFNPSILLTPKTKSTRQIPVSSPAVGSTARLNLPNKEKGREKKWGCGFYFWRLVLGMSLILVAELGFHRVVPTVLNPKLSPVIVRNAWEGSWVVQDLNGRLEHLQRELQGFVDGKVANCSDMDYKWKVNQDGLLLSSHCTLYKSVTEEVNIWGWPLQTAGLLTTEFSSRSFTILSGRVTEWSNGKFGYLIRMANSSWIQRKWSASAVQLDPGTWVLEYQHNSILENSRLCSAAAEFVMFRMARLLGSIKQQLWKLPEDDDFTTGESFKVPT
ncbi:uncharacterized protein LOC131151010 [Malania oleifera]|uniref:uncharacterized protein LOC131151010 n=1 Tax=Malania oleifera TaxID=397392 RepID=UPI0025AE59F7|nr:uncharacterized protein LOC131151010 [Malania oleifera]